VLESLKNGKAPGPRNIHHELLRTASELIFPALTFLFNAVTSLEVVPTQWKEGIIHPIFKKGDKKDIENYRPIVVLDSIRRVFERTILLDYLQAAIEPLDISQGGFRTKRGTIDQTAALNETILAQEKKTKRWPIVCYLDIKAAYDRVDRTLLWPLLEKKGVSGPVIRTLTNLFENVSTTLNVRGKASTRILHERGLVQGSTLSPLLYAVYIDDLPGRLRTASSCKLGTLHTPAFLYADDIAIVANSPTEMQALLNECEAFSIERRFRFAPMKCAYTDDPKREAWTPIIHDTPIPLVSSFRYLGVTMHHRGIDRLAHVEAMAASSNDALRFFRQIGFHGNGFDIKTKTHLYRTFIRSRLEYGLQVMSKVAVKRLQREQNFSLRCMFSLPRNTSTAVTHSLGNMPSIEARRRALFAKWIARTRQLDRTFMVRVAYESAGPRPRLASSFYWEKHEKTLLPPRSAAPQPTLGKEVNKKAEEMFQTDIAVWRNDELVKECVPIDFDAETLRRKLEDRKKADITSRSLSQLQRG
jgi:hypothetical protein